MHICTPIITDTSLRKQVRKNYVCFSTTLLQSGRQGSKNQRTSQADSIMWMAFMHETSSGRRSHPSLTTTLYLIQRRQHEQQKTTQRHAFQEYLRRHTNVGGAFNFKERILNCSSLPAITSLLVVVHWSSFYHRFTIVCSAFSWCGLRNSLEKDQKMERGSNVSSVPSRGRAEVWNCEIKKIFSWFFMFRF